MVLLAICQISKCAYFKIIKNKSAPSAKKGLKEIIAQIRRKKLKIFRGIDEFEYVHFFSDRGGEFDNLELQKFLHNSNSDISLMSGNKVR